MTVTLLMEWVDVQIQTKEDKFCCSFSASLTFLDPDFNSESRAETRVNNFNFFHRFLE